MTNDQHPWRRPTLRLPTLSAGSRRLAALALAWQLVAAGLVAAGPFSRLIVFGDSLSDVGNVAQSSFDIFPGRYYYNDRFSNGPVWVESLSTGLGLGTIAPSTAGGDNFAYGGAQTAGTEGLPGIVIDDVDEQVADYLETRSPDPLDLFVVFAGSNDLIGGDASATDAVANLAADLDRLIAAGARQFLVPNLPLLGRTPRHNGDPVAAAAVDALSLQFNAALDAMLTTRRQDHAELTLFRLDVATLFADAIADPTSYGLVNVTAPAAPGLEPGFATYNTSLIAPNANEYLFWDDLHPTATVHAVLAQRALTLLLDMPGDFDGNGVVDASDLDLWKTGYGAASDATRHQGDADADRDVDGADLLAWQRQYGRSVNSQSLSPASVTVPEPAGPAAMPLLAAAAGTAIAQVRRRATARKPPRS